MNKKDFPTVNRIKAFRDSLTMSGNAIQIFSKYLEKLGSSYYFPFGGIKKALVTTDPKIIEHVLQKNYKNYPKSEIQINKMGQFLGQGLLTSRGPYWLTQRRIIQEGFKKDRLKSYLQEMEIIVEKNLQKLDFNNSNFDLDAFLTNTTFNMVMRSLFTQQITHEDLNQIASTIGTVQKYILNQIVKPYLTPWTKISGEYRRHQINRTASDDIILNIVRNRKLGSEFPLDMLDILLQAKYIETGEGMSEQQVLMESMQLIVAGHETSSTALLWLIYLLSQNPVEYNKVKSELENIDEITMESLMSLRYTLQVIEETLRLYPPFWMIDRNAIADDEISGYSIKKGTMILIYIYGVHHNEKFWKNAECFNPKRFSDINSKKETPFTYLPFGSGPKGCIGANYASLQMLVILKKLLTRFDITLNENKVELKPLIILKPKAKIHFNLTVKV